MKCRIVVFLLIVAAICGFGWYNARGLSQVRERQRILRDEAGRLGILPGQSGGMLRQPKPHRNTAAAGKMLAPEDIALMKELEQSRKPPAKPVAGFWERHAAMVARIKAMTPAQIRKFIAEARAHEELSPESRQMLVQTAIEALIDQSPAAGLDLYTGMQDLFSPDNVCWSVSGGVVKWAKKDPSAALDWVRGNLAEHSDLINNDARCAVAEGAALSDRKLAFRLIGELGIDPPANATQGIVDTAKTPAERIAALADLREYAPTIEDRDDRFRAKDYAIAVFGKNLAKEDFQAAIVWVASAGLTNSEIASFGSDIGCSVKNGDQAKWLDWFSEKLAAGGYQRAVCQLITNWTAKDHEAVGNWLNAAPTGPVKNYAISVFADEVAHYQPDAAIQWAVTLPAGKARDETLHTIYHNWPKKDPAGEAAAAAFEKEYNIQHHH